MGKPRTTALPKPVDRVAAVIAQCCPTFDQGAAAPDSLRAIVGQCERGELHPAIAMFIVTERLASGVDVVSFDLAIDAIFAAADAQGVPTDRAPELDAARDRANAAERRSRSRARKFHHGTTGGMGAGLEVNVAMKERASSPEWRGERGDHTGGRVSPVTVSQTVWAVDMAGTIEPAAYVRTARTVAHVGGRAMVTEHVRIDRSQRTARQWCVSPLVAVAREHRARIRAERAKNAQAIELDALAASSVPLAH